VIHNKEESVKKAAAFLFVVYLSVLPLAVPAETIKIVADDWCPYNCKPGSEYPGYVVEVAEEVFKNAGYRLEYEYVPWARALKEVTRGTYNGAIAATPQEAPNCIFPDEELGYYANDFIIRKGEPWRFVSMSSLEGIRLGAIDNYNYGENVNSYIERHKHTLSVQVLSGNRAVERNLKKLLQQKIDVYLEDRNVAYFTAKQMGIIHRIAWAGNEGKPIALYIAFSPAIPESKKHARILSEGIRTLRKSGRLSEILRKYGVKDWN
jgi:polar amino acid transport system substrate-binding protein